MLKQILRSFVISLAAFIVTIEAIPTIDFEDDLNLFLLIVAIIFAGAIIIKPLFKIAFFLPLNFFTMHLAGLLTNILILFSITFLVPQFRITAYDFYGYSYQGFTIPPVSLNYIQTLIAAAVVISLVAAFLNWLAE